MVTHNTCNGSALFVLKYTSKLPSVHNYHKNTLPLRVMCTMFHTKLTNIGNFFSLLLSGKHFAHNLKDVLVNVRENSGTQLPSRDSNVSTNETVDSVDCGLYETNMTLLLLLAISSTVYIIRSDRTRSAAINRTPERSCESLKTSIRLITRS